MLGAASGRAQMTIRLTSVPAGTPADAAIYLAGTFNDWNPGSASHKLARQADGTYALTLPRSAGGKIEFKFTLGAWERVEESAAGGDVPNRVLMVPDSGPVTYSATVEAWREPATTGARKSTARKSVSLLSDSFPMPQLGRARRVWIYLPPDYAGSKKRYPVLYMQDGQNVFDAATSFVGEWGVDETLDSLHAAGDPGIIVVAVDHGGRSRSEEYHPWPALAGRSWGGGKGNEYADFVALTLKPYIDRHYRTRPDRGNTAIAGSSSGGVIAVYAALKYPRVFGSAIAFSPAFFVNPELFALARGSNPRPRSRYYFASGLNETVPGVAPGVFAGAQREMVEALRAAGLDTRRNVRSLLPADGEHSEWFWRREFAAAYLWTFGSNAAFRVVHHQRGGGRATAARSASGAARSR